MLDENKYEIPNNYTFKLWVKEHGHFNWLDHAEAPTYSLNVFYNCLSDDEIIIVQGNPTNDE